MAIKKLPSGSYQARFSISQDEVLTRTFPTRVEAEGQVIKWKKDKKERRLSLRDGSRHTLDAYFDDWFRGLNKTESGWRKCQLQIYRDFVHPVLGSCRLGDVRPRAIQKVLVTMAENGKSEQTRVHVFNLLRKMYSDAIETYEFVTFNPVLRSLKPKIPLKEALHLNREQAVRLAEYVEHRKYGLAIWLQLYLGLRLGEVQGLRWEDVDLETGRIYVRRVYVRKTEAFRDYPKSRKHRVQHVPPELGIRLSIEKVKRTGDLVVTSPQGNVLPYRWYLARLAKYCRDLGVPHIGTHGLRHSTSELYLGNGATKDDVRELLGHSSFATTERYLHGRNDNLEKVSSGVSLFPERSNTKVEHAGKSA